MRRLLIWGLLISAVSGLTAQNNQWTLEKCIDYTLKNNLQVKQLELQEQQIAASNKANKLSRLPNLNAGAGYGMQLGRTIDPTTNTFQQQNINFSNLSLSAGMTIYNGNRINNTIKQGKLNAQAARLETRAAANDAALAVANAYLTVLLGREQLSNARGQLQLTEDQLAQTRASIDAGSLPESRIYDLVAQKANNERSIVELENQVKLSLVNLQISMMMTPADDFNIITPDLEISDADLTDLRSFDEVYMAATQTQPELKAAEIRSQSADYNEKIARSGYLPSLSIGASMSSNYSSLSRVADTSNITFGPGAAVPVLIGGEQTTLQQYSVMGLKFKDKPFFDQLNENFGQSLSLNLNIPIFSQGRNAAAVQQAKLQKAQAELQYKQAENTLRNEVIRALADLRAARSSYEAALVSTDAAEKAYTVTKRSYDLGAANNMELINATNRLDQARIEQTRSKFQLIFNRQVIEFYLDNPLKL